MTEEKPVRKKTRRGTGFTLLELIAVMGIIVALSLVVVSGYASIMRTMSEMAGVNALRKAAMLCRQHACIDGRKTYFFITGFDTYVLCRKAGKISDRNNNYIEPEDRPAYMAGNDYKPGTVFLYDQYSDLGASSEDLGNDRIEEYSESGALIFDLSTGKSTQIWYPPWFNYKRDRWVMGINEAAEGFRKDPVTQEYPEYGWTVYPEQKLPKGYAFVLKETKDKFFDIEKDKASFYFNPEGTAGSDDDSLVISVQELGTKKVSTITIHANGKVESDY